MVRRHVDDSYKSESDEQTDPTAAQAPPKPVETVRRAGPARGRFQPRRNRGGGRSTGRGGRRYVRKLVLNPTANDFNPSLGLNPAASDFVTVMQVPGQPELDAHAEDFYPTQEW